jgi:hypothetical protein
MDKDRVVWFYTGTRCMHLHPEFTSGSHGIGEDTGLKRCTKPTEFSMTVDKKIPDQARGMTTNISCHT